MNKIIFLNLLFLTISQAHADLAESYDSFSAKEKRAILWENSIKNDYDLDHLDTSKTSFLEKGKLFLKSYLLPAFNHTSDELPEGRKRLIHEFGSVAKVKWIPSDHSPFTGLFSTGGLGLIRVSLATLGDPYIPGLALKILIDGAPSVNFHVMYSLDGQGSNRNFFFNTFSNVIPSPTGILAFAAVGFNRAASALGLESATALKVEEAARIRNTGVLEKNLKTPEQLDFIPNAETKRILSVLDQNDLRKQVSSPHFKAGLTLYQIYGREKAQTELIFLGELILDDPDPHISAFVASKYVDENLFFQHQKPLSH